MITDRAKIERSCVALHGRQLNENVIVIPWKLVLVSAQPIPIRGGSYYRSIRSLGYVANPTNRAFKNVMGRHSISLIEPVHSVSFRLTI